MKHLDRTVLLILALVGASLSGACRSGDDDDDSADGDADSDSDGDSDGDSDADADTDADGDADADGDGDADCTGEDTNATCSDQLDNNDDGFTDCTDFCCSRWTPAVTVCDPTDPTPIEDVRQGVVAEGTRVLLENMIVTAIDSDTSWYMQSADAADPDYTGVFVFVPSSNPDDITIPTVGDIINLVGETDEYYGLTEMSYVREPEVVSSGNDLPAPVSVTPDEIGDEDGTAGDRAEPLESVLVQVMAYVTNLEPTPGANDDDPTNEFAVGAAADGPDLLRIDDHTYLLDPLPAVGDSVMITGNVRYGHDHFKLEPRNQADLESM